MIRVRSPNYPAISLPEAIERVKSLHAKAQQKAITREQAVEAMGYDGLHGASLGAISALLKYGLIEKVEDGVRVSSRAMEIIAPATDEERANAISEAAFDPPLFAELHERFLGDIPSDEKMRAYLVRKNFSKSALDRVIRAYRETIGLVSDAEADYVDEIEEVEQGVEKAPQSAGKTLGRIAAQKRGLDMESLPKDSLRVSFTDSRLEVVANLADAEAVDKLIKALEANKALLPARPVDVKDLPPFPSDVKNN